MLVRVGLDHKNYLNALVRILDLLKALNTLGITLYKSKLASLMT